MILTPDAVRGDALTLREVILKHGWPLLKDLRGKVLFCLDNEGDHRDLYLEGNPALEGRLMFVSVDQDHPGAAWMKRNNPVQSLEEIQALVKKGFLVRTRADADGVEARAGDFGRCDIALASGAHCVSTDFPQANSKIGPYQVSLPGKVVARWNPLLRKPGAPEGELE
jgi:hypothetical protein